MAATWRAIGRTRASIFSTMARCCARFCLRRSARLTLLGAAHGSDRQRQLVERIQDGIAER